LVGSSQIQLFQRPLQVAIGHISLAQLGMHLCRRFSLTGLAALRQLAQAVAVGVRGDTAGQR